MNDFYEHLRQNLSDIQSAGLYKSERVIVSAQGEQIRLDDGTEVVNFCANNYLGLSNDARVVTAAKKTLDDYGYGMSSVRFICGTQSIHKALEAKVSEFLQTDDTILYAAAFDANGGLFEPLFTAEDAIISDQLNHASIIDGVRLCKAARYRYAHNDMADLEKKLQESQAQRFRVIITDGVFSMDGTIAQLEKICDLADKYNALVFVDECHATGIIGATGRGTVEYRNVMGRVDAITGTFGKALGGASGGFTTGKKEIIDMLRQKSRPYLFSNTVPPVVVGASLAVLNLLSNDASKVETLAQNTQYFRTEMTNNGFDIKPGEHPIVPIMLYEATVAQEFAKKLLAEGVYVIGFFFPVVPHGQARIRVQISATHTKEQLDKTIAAFAKIGKELGVI